MEQQVSLYCDFDGGSLSMQERGSSIPYILAMCLRLIAQVLLLSGEVERIYLIISLRHFSVWIGPDTIEEGEHVTMYFPLHG